MRYEFLKLGVFCRFCRNLRYLWCLNLMYTVCDGRLPIHCWVNDVPPSVAPTNNGRLLVVTSLLYWVYIYCIYIYTYRPYTKLQTGYRPNKNLQNTGPLRAMTTSALPESQNLLWSHIHFHDRLFLCFHLNWQSL